MKRHQGFSILIMIAIAAVAVGLALEATAAAEPELVRLRAELATYPVPTGSAILDSRGFARPGEASVTEYLRPTGVSALRQQLTEILAAHAFAPAGEFAAASGAIVACFSRAPSDRATLEASSTDAALTLSWGGSSICSGP
jgi:hypothetical protein